MLLTYQSKLNNYNNSVYANVSFIPASWCNVCTCFHSTDFDVRYQPNRKETLEPLGFSKESNGLFFHTEVRL